jgi:hypothetical protein
MTRDHIAVPLEPGTRVQVRRDAEFPPGPWPSEPTGTIDALPSSIQRSLRGPLRMYWVRIDEPQFDLQGDSAYVKAEVAHIYLEVIPEA